KFGHALSTEYADGEAVRAHGYAVHRGEVIVLQLDGALQHVDRQLAPVAPLRDSGEQTLAGEIVDSKCWAGAMNPGDGKAHRGCGSLCLLGNIPALFIVSAPGAAMRWFVLADADGEPLDEVIRLHIGERLTLTGRVYDAPDLHEFRLDWKSVEQLLTIAS